MLLQKIKYVVVTLLIVLTGSATFAPGGVSADFKGDACAGVNVVSGGSGCSSTAGTTVTRIIKVVVNILSVLVGAAAVIMVVFSGYKYITSAGDSSKVSSAKNTLIYALVGLIVVASAQTLVHFTLAKVK